jgi:hypothetical protein
MACWTALFTSGSRCAAGSGAANAPAGKMAINRAAIRGRMSAMLRAP